MSHSTSVPAATTPPTTRALAHSRAIAPAAQAVRVPKIAPVAPHSSVPPHIMVIMMENESASDLIGSPDAPNVNSLAAQYGLATDSYSIAHPSLPNYLELLSGSDYGVTDDGSPSSESVPATATTLVNELETARISWKASNMESMPSAGYAGGDSMCCGGQYYQHHNPFVYFPSVTPPFRISHRKWCRRPAS